MYKRGESTMEFLLFVGIIFVALILYYCIFDLNECNKIIKDFEEKTGKKFTYY